MISQRLVYKGGSLSGCYLPSPSNCEFFVVPSVDSGLREGFGEIGGPGKGWMDGLGSGCNYSMLTGNCFL